ncbi:MAG: DoxX family protein [Balneolaceae bacterium]|nr:MAG: DoxX family protein [Balneolaceae bacterium]
MTQLNSRNSDFALLLLRVGVGVIFIIAGWGKLTGIEGTQQFFGNIGIPLPAIMAWVVAIVEFFGGILVLFGAYAKIPYLLLAITMAVALFTTKLGGEFSAARLDIMLLLTTLALFFLGSGAYSVDHKIENR